MTEEIYTAAAGLAKPEKAEEPLLRMFCQAAEEALRRRDDRLPAEHREAFLCAAGCLAAADLIDSRSAGDGVSHFTVGDVSVTRAGGGAADRLRRQADHLLAPYCAQDGFAFLGVRG